MDGGAYLCAHSFLHIDMKLKNQDQEQKNKNKKKFALNRI